MQSHSLRPGALGRGRKLKGPQTCMGARLSYECPPGEHEPDPRSSATCVLRVLGPLAGILEPAVLLPTWF